MWGAGENWSNFPVVDKKKLQTGNGRNPRNARRSEENLDGEPSAGRSEMEEASSNARVNTGTSLFSRSNPGQIFSNNCWVTARMST
jgi:hypothetical protein